jgi:hydroxymethylbilane synthase
VRIGTRASLLARAQASAVASALSAATGLPTELVPVTTHGDVSREPLARIGGAGVFVSALRAALLDGTVDVAVHSFKDLPTEPAEGIQLAAVPVREDPWDVLVARGRTLADLPSGAKIGTGSPRRAAQLRALAGATGRAWTVVDVRGNVDTRIRLVTSGELDAVVLARAGLARLGRLDVVSQTIDSQLMLPAPGQGALAVEVRADDPVAALVARLDDQPTHWATTAGRAVLATLGAGCAAPVGAWAQLRAEVLTLHALAATPDGSLVIRRRLTRQIASAAEASAAGTALAHDLLSDPAATALPLATGSVREHP